MLEGNMLDFPTTLASQPEPAAAPTHNGFSLAVRGVRFCGGTMKMPSTSTLSPILHKKSETSCVRPIIPHPQPQQASRPIVKSAPVTQRRRSSTSGRKITNALITTPIPTSIPADVTSRLKSNTAAADRLKFSDRLNALLKTGDATSNDFEDDKDPYAFVDSEKQQQILQKSTVVKNNIRKQQTINPTINVVHNKTNNNSKKRKLNNVPQQPGTTTAKNVLIQQSIVKTQQIITSKQTNLVRTQQQQQNVITTSSSPLININNNNASIITQSGTSLLRNVKFTDQIINNRRIINNDNNKLITQPNSIIHSNNSQLQQQQIVTRIPLTIPNNSTIPQQMPPLIKTSSSTSTTIIEEKTTMNQLQAKIARNKVMGKHRNKISSHTQSIIANPSNVISSQQLSKFKEKSLLEEQLLKNEKLKQNLKTVTQHFTFPAKNAGSVVTYKKPVSSAVTDAGMVTLASKKSKKIVSKLPSSSVEASNCKLQRIEDLRLEAKAYRQDLFPLGLEESDSGDDSDHEEGVAFQRHWFLQTPAGSSRESRLKTVKATLRRRYLQLRRSEAHCLSPDIGSRPGSPDTPAVRALISSARSQPNRTAALILAREEESTNPLTLLARVRKHKHRSRNNDLLGQTRCCYTDCTSMSLPCTRHCVKHIMYNVDQLLFEHCTAKFADNTQCCVPVFDILHELPLCLEHARKRDNYNKNECRPKKTRRKAKPSAMTRPSKRGKKKKKGGSPVTPPMLPNIPVQQPIEQPMQAAQPVQQVQPVQPVQPMVIHQQHVIKMDNSQQIIYLTQPPQHIQHHIQQQQHHHHQHHQQQIIEETQTELMESQDMTPMLITTEDSLSQSQPDTMLADTQGCSDSDNDMAGLLQEVEAQAEALSPGTMLSDELPLEETAEELAQQASTLLEEHDDLASVLYQIPADTLNELFNGEKTGEYEPTREETEELERALAAVDKDVKKLEKMSRQQNGPSNNGNTTNILPSELVDSILGPHLVDDHTLSLALRHHTGSVAKEEVVVDSSMLSGQHSQMLVQQGLTIADTTVNGFTNDLHSHLLPSQDSSMIQLDAAVFPPDAMVQLGMQGQTYLLHQSGGTLHQTLHQAATGTQHHQQQQTISFPASEVSSLMHHNLLPQMPLLTEQLLNPAVYGGGAAPPPTPNSVHQPAVGNTPPFHPHQNGYLISQQQYDAKSGVVFASPSPAMSPAQFSPATPNSVLNISAGQTHTDS